MSAPTEQEIYRVAEELQDAVSGLSRVQNAIRLGEQIETAIIQLNALLEEERREPTPSLPKGLSGYLWLLTFQTQKLMEALKASQNPAIDRRNQGLRQIERLMAQARGDEQSDGERGGTEQNTPS